LTKFRWQFSDLEMEEYNDFITNSILLATKEAIPSAKEMNTCPQISEASKRLITLKQEA